MNTPPEWAIARAKMVLSQGEPHEALAWYIASQEAPDASPEIRCAREACAQAYEGNQNHRAAANYRKGLYDDGDDWEIWIAVKAIEIWKHHQEAEGK